MYTVIRVVFQLSDEIPCISAVVVALLAEVCFFCLGLTFQFYFEDPLVQLFKKKNPLVPEMYMRTIFFSFSIAWEQASFLCNIFVFETHGFPEIAAKTENRLRTESRGRKPDRNAWAFRHD